MEGQYPLNVSQRANFSRDGARPQSREKLGQTPELRKKTSLKPGAGTLSVSGQNFFNASGSQFFQSENSSSAEDLMLASLNIAVDETAFISMTKADLLQLQEEINKLDVDGKIRGASSSSLLKKNHVYAMRKFLSKISPQPAKTLIEKRLGHSANFDTDDLLKFMGVKSESEGLRKLFKMLGMLDLMLVKLTEFQTVTFLKYDSLFEDLKKQFGGAPAAKTSVMDSGINVSRFQVDLANMERLTELFSFVGKSSSQQKNKVDSKNQLDDKDNVLKTLESVEDLYKALVNREKLGFNPELSSNLSELIEKSMEFRTKEHSYEKKIRSLEKELQEKTSKMTTLVEFSSAPEREEDTQAHVRAQQLKEEVENTARELTKRDAEIKKLKIEIEDVRSAAKKSSDKPQELTSGEVFNADYYIKMIKQIEDNYGAKSKSVEDDNNKKEQDLINLRIKLETTERERDDLLDSLSKLELQMQKNAQARLKGSDGSYEAALKEQFEYMKEGFENKIKGLTTEMQQVKKEKSLEVLEIKKELTREKDNRELLLRKLQIYTKT